MTETAPDLKSFEFLMAVMAASHNETMTVTNWVVDAEKQRADRAEATLDLIRNRIIELLDGPYMPNPYLLEKALWPSDQAIEQQMKEESHV